MDVRRLDSAFFPPHADGELFNGRLGVFALFEQALTKVFNAGHRRQIVGEIGVLHPLSAARQTKGRAKSARKDVIGHDEQGHQNHT